MPVRHRPTDIRQTLPVVPRRWMTLRPPGYTGGSAKAARFRYVSPPANPRKLTPASGLVMTGTPRIWSGRAAVIGFVATSTPIESGDPDRAKWLPVTLQPPTI